MARAIAENETHYVLTAGLPRLRELIAVLVAASARRAVCGK